VAFTECFPHQRVGTAGGHPWTTCFPCTNGSFRFHVKLALLCRGLRFRRLAGRVPGKLASQLLSAWRMFQTGSSEDVNVAPLRMSNNLHCGYWSAVSPCVSSTQAGGPPRQHKQRSATTLPREKTPRALSGNPLLLLPRWGEVRGAAVERCCRFGPLRWPGLPPPCRVSALAGAVGSTGAAARCCGCGAVCGGRGGALHRRCRAGRAAARGVLLWRSAAAVAGAVGSTSAATPACRWRWTCRRGGGLGRAL
jgi:hypothetical protein